MSKADFSELGSALRHARLQLGWSQELFAEKAILATRTIVEAESGGRIYPKTFKAMIEAINKARSAARPPVGPLVLEYPSAPRPTKTTGQGPESAPAEGVAPSPSFPDAGSYPEIETLQTPVEEPASDSTLSEPVKGIGDPPLIVWPENTHLLTIAGERWGFREACQGTVIFGATGSGKTSGSGQLIARGCVAAGFGGLVLCAKPDEAQLWIKYAGAIGRQGDLVLFGRDPKWTFNFLEHESRRQGGGANLTENLVNLFTEVASIGAGSAGGSSSDPFWERAMKSLVRNCVDLLAAAGAPITLHNMFDVVRSSPANLESIQSDVWKSSSACWKRLEASKNALAGGAARMDFHEVASYWLEHFPSLGERTRGSIVAMFLTLSEALMRSKMRELFCSGTSIAPEDALAGKIIVIDLPVKEWGEVGRISAVLWKYCFQKTVERRKDNESGRGRPVFLWADECQYFFSRHDSLFQATARSSRAATVYLTQSIPSLVAAIGAESDGRSIVDSVLNNMATKIFHANSDPTTNEFASNLIGKRVGRLRNRSNSMGPSSKDDWLPFGNVTNSWGYSEHIDFAVHPHEFNSLKRGGIENGFVVEGIVLMMGRSFGTRRENWCKAAFAQNLVPWTSWSPIPKPSRRKAEMDALLGVLAPWLRPKPTILHWMLFYIFWSLVAGVVLVYRGHLADG